VTTVAAVLAIGTHIANAQVADPPTTGTQTVRSDRADDDGFDLGLLGLAGLAGLAGLMRKDRDHNRVTTSTGTTTHR
jgi:MYXO-CTERM domain-containing protein